MAWYGSQSEAAVYRCLWLGIIFRQPISPLCFVGSCLCEVACEHFIYYTFQFVLYCFCVFHSINMWNPYHAALWSECSYDDRDKYSMFRSWKFQDNEIHWHQLPWTMNQLDYIIYGCNVSSSFFIRHCFYGPMYHFVFRFDITSHFIRYAYRPPFASTTALFTVLYVKRKSAPHLPFCTPLCR